MVWTMRNPDCRSDVSHLMIFLKRIQRRFSPAAVLLFAAVLVFLSGFASAEVQTEKRIRIENGMARQILRYSDPRDASYTNDGSDILRFAVYVETDYDTDLDGKPDLVKAMVQLPRPAAEGSYQAPVIYEARPYIAGMYLYHPALKEVHDADFDESVLYSRPEKRKPAGTVTALEMADRADPADWNYSFADDPFEMEYLGNLTAYDYYLVRGFAVVQCAGLGTWGSEGIECCTSDLEMEAFRCVVEWLTGRRNAFSDSTGCLAAASDWCSGRIGMIGRSYAGSMAFEVASTGVEGLDTIVSVAGPASWYEYANSQGIPSGLYDSYGFIADLASTCASRFFAGANEGLLRFYDNYLSFLRDREIDSAGDFGDFWAAREYSGRDGFKASALIVQGTNDAMVHPRQFDLMRNAFLRSGCEVKALLHRNGHVTPANEQTKTDILIGDYTFTEWLNRWFSHYLLDADNGVNLLPALTVQDNTNGVFFSTDRWNTDHTIRLNPGDTDLHTVSAENAHMANPALLQETFTGVSGPDRLLWSMDAEETLTISGTSVIHIRAKTSDTDKKVLMLGAVLVDQADTAFPCYNVGWSEVLGQTVLTKEGVDRGEGVEPYDLVQWDQEMKNRTVIAWGAADMRNPEAGYAPETAVARETPIENDTWYDYDLYLQPN